jgi:hypothetical protein
MPSDSHFSRVGGYAALIGIVLIIVATALQATRAHPAEVAAVFAEYARDEFRVLKHLLQLAGFLLVSAGCLALSWRLRVGRAGVWALLAGASVLACLALGAVQMAVEGIALTFMADHLAVAPRAAQTAVFEAAFALRQVEVGLDSLLGMLFGLTVVLYGIAILIRGVAVWLAVLAMVGGLCAIASSLVQAHMGYSDIAMATGMFSNLIVTMWVIGVGVVLLKRTGAMAVVEAVAESAVGG